MTPDPKVAADEVIPRFGGPHPVGGPATTGQREVPASGTGVRRGPVRRRVRPVQASRPQLPRLRPVPPRPDLGPGGCAPRRHRLPPGEPVAPPGPEAALGPGPRDGRGRPRGRGPARTAVPGALGRRTQCPHPEGIIHATDTTLDARRLCRNRAGPGRRACRTIRRPRLAGARHPLVPGADAGDRGPQEPGSVLGRRPDSSTTPARSAPAVFRSVSESLDDTAADALRERARAASMYLEGIVSLPRDQADLGRFEAEIRTAKRAGAEVVRTVMLSGRRYETFATAAAFRRFAESSSHALSLAAPVVARHDIRLAVENHKDWRADELLAILKRVGNDHVGVCLDTGNSIALLEDPMEVVEALAPRAFTTHFKDMGVEEYRQGFLLAEVPLGTGILDLPRVVRIVRAARA